MRIQFSVDDLQVIEKLLAHEWEHEEENAYPDADYQTELVEIRMKVTELLKVAKKYPIDIEVGHAVIKK